MQTVTKTQLWTGRILSGIAALFMFMDGAVKVAGLAPAMEGASQLGYPPSTMFPIGVAALVATALYVLPRTSVLGAILLTGFLGGAIATHVRMENPLFSHVLFPTYVAAFIWGGLVLRNAKLRAVLFSTESGRASESEPHRPLSTREATAR